MTFIYRHLITVKVVNITQMLEYFVVLKLCLWIKSVKLTIHGFQQTEYFNVDPVSE
jgi:hypothetical protein